METWIDVAGITVHSPVTVVTNLALSVQCALYYRRLRNDRGERSAYWSLFFLAMAVATLAGAPKHGLRASLPGEAYALVLWVSGLAGAASTYFAQRATVASRAAEGAASFWLALCGLELTAFLCVGLAVGPQTWLVVANTALGLVPVIVAESVFAARGSTGAAWVVAGLGVSLLTGAVYVGRMAAGPWFNHVDAAHVLMLVSFALIVRGATDRGARAPEPAESRGVGALGIG